jgi:hypothetical protein
MSVSLGRVKMLFEVFHQRLEAGPIVMRVGDKVSNILLTGDKTALGNNRVHFLAGNRLA